MKAGVALWDRLEPGHVLAAVRILVALVILWDFGTLWYLDLVEPIYGAREAGGLGDPMARKRVPSV